MYVCGYPTRPAKVFSRESEKSIEDLFKNFYVSFGTTTSGVCPVKRQGFASSVRFNLIEMTLH